MRRFKSLSIFVLLVLLVSVSLGATVVHGALLKDSQEVVIREHVIRYLETRWNLLVNPTISLVDFYYRDAQSLDAVERERFERHYLEPARRAGFRYTGVELQIEFKSIEIEKSTARVEVVVDVSYTSEYPDDPRPVISKEAGLEHEILLVRQGERWYIVVDRYFDIFSKRGSKGQDIPLLDGEVPGTFPKDGSSEGVVPLWYHHYNRAGAVAYADRWWNSHNPRYRYFPGDDCTNYVSQCFDDGGQALMAWRAPFVWWYDFHSTGDVWDDTWSTSWAVPHDQAYNLSRNTNVDEMRGSYVASARELTLGDSLYYDFDGDGILDHSAIVVEIRNGEPYVNYHTNNTYHRHWDLGAVTTRFLHVTDWFWIN
ncbi:MAG: amidase domain-containing protein [Thermoflexales bacterium]|nr:amidase domain-containing protein [Thermoflexales bacterium]